MMPINKFAENNNRVLDEYVNIYGKKPRRQRQLMETNELIDRLGENNILAVPYRKPPVGVNTFSLGISHNPEVVRLWSGRTATVNVVNGDPDRKQAIINVEEGKRAIERRVTIKNWWAGSGHPPTKIDFTGRFPIVIPNAQFAVTGIKRTDSRGSHDYASYQATVTARAPHMNQSFLVGMDEVAYFCAVLPVNATTIKSAHQALRPSGLSKVAIRQGEWFFTPATKDELRTIKRVLKTYSEPHPGRWEHPTYATVGGVRVRIMPLEAMSSHHAATLVIPGTGRFAIGDVTDSRTGHHAPLPLADWHRVTRNAEVIDTRRNTVQRRSSWD